MTTKMKYLGISAVALAGALALAPHASAQAVAVADLNDAVAKTSAFTNAMTQIRATYKTQLDQAAAIAKEEVPLYAAIDTDKDGQLSQDEVANAQATKNPALATLTQKEQQRRTLEAPAARAQAYALEQITAKLQQAYTTVKAAKRVSLLIRPEAAFDYDANADITPDITAELNKLVPSVSITPPAGWAPGGKSAPAAPAPSGPLPSGVPGASSPPPVSAPVPGKKPAGR